MFIKPSEYRKRLPSRAKALDSPSPFSRANASLINLRLSTVMTGLRAPLTILLLVLMTLAQPALGLAQQNNRRTPGTGSSSAASLYRRSTAALRLTGAASSGRS
jgi:hypothetical protein